jgi:hypothetical protein
MMLELLLSSGFSAGLLLLMLPYTHAVPLKRQGLGIVSTVTTLSGDEISSFTPFIQFAAAAYCPISKGTECGSEVFFFFASFELLSHL